MRVDLGNLEGSDAELKLPLDDDGPPRHLRLRRLTSLSGVLERQGGGLRLSDVSADEVQLAATQWTFGSVSLASPAPCKLEQPELEMTLGEGPIELDLSTAVVEFTRLEIEVGDTRVSGAAHLVGATLKLAEGRGTIQAESARIQDFELQLGALTLRAPELDVTRLSLGWGDPDGFHMAAQNAGARLVTAEAASMQVSATQVDLQGFEVARGGVSALSLAAKTLGGELTLGSGAAAEDDGPRRPAPEASRPTFDLESLDALMGQLVADTRFEVRLPGGLRRKLKLPLRLDISEGSIDYRALERSLPSFEDSLLDFSRDGDWLVLEIGLPLLPTRGRGKQLLRWPLRSADGSTMKGRQVRLSALPRYQRPGQSERASTPSEAPEAPASGGRSLVQLERAFVRVGPMELQLPPPSQHLDAALELITFQQARIEGELTYVRDDPQPGHLLAQLEALEVRLSALPLGAKQLGGELTARRVGELRMQTRAFTPHALTLAAEDVRLRNVRHG